MYVRSVILAAAALGACATIPPLTPMPLTPAQIKTVEEGARRGLKDPDSAKFEGIVGGRNAQGDVFACGYVNSRNSFGGYVGMQPFGGMITNVAGEQFTLISMGSDQASRYALAATTCRGLVNP